MLGTFYALLRCPVDLFVLTHIGSPYVALDSLELATLSGSQAAPLYPAALFTSHREGYDYTQQQS